MTITEVSNTHLIKEFLDVPKLLYKEDKVWVCPLDNDIEKIFNPDTNSFHKHGVVTRWVLKDDQARLIGRISAFINFKKCDTEDGKIGGIGFFECIDSQEAADLLFNTAAGWLSAQSVTAMDGPINFGENDTFWGLLVEGFTHPSYGMNYNFPYYQKLFTNYGFITKYDQITNHLNVNKPFPERFTKIAQWVAQKPGYRFEPLRIKEIDRFAEEFMEIYNDAWKDFDNFTPINRETIIETFRKMKPVLDEKLIWFSYVNDEPASFVVILPDINQIIKGFNGKLGIIEKLKFVYRKWKGVSRMRAIVMGTKTAYQKHGLESAMFIKLKEYVLPLNQYEELELSWVGDFNHKMLSLHDATGATFAKKHSTLRKIF